MRLFDSCALSFYVHGERSNVLVLDLSLGIVQTADKDVMLLVVFLL